MEVKWSPLDHKWHDAEYSEYNEHVARFLNSTICNLFPSSAKDHLSTCQYKKGTSKNQAQNANHEATGKNPEVHCCILPY